MSDEQIQTLPLAGYEIRTVPAYDALILSFSIIPHASARPDEVVHHKHYLVHTAQAAQLAESILSALQKVKTADKTPPGSHSH